MLKKPDQNRVFKFSEKGTVLCVHSPGHDVKIHVPKSLDERLLEIAGIGFLIVAMARTMQCWAVTCMSRW